MLPALLVTYCSSFTPAGKTRTILNLLSVVMHSAAKGSLELVPSVAKRAASAVAAAGSSDGLTPDAAAERQRLWQQQSPWMFGQPTIRELVGPTAATGKRAVFISAQRLWQHQHHTLLGLLAHGSTTSLNVRWFCLLRPGDVAVEVSFSATY